MVEVLGVIRNFIEVVGIAQEEELPEKSFGQLIKYSEAEHIIIPRDKSGIKDIYQIVLKIEIKSKRTISTVDTKTVILDGIKNVKIMCTQHENPDKVTMINLQLPYNTFFEIPRQIENIDNTDIHILDAYFEVLDKRRIYGHFVYLVDVRYLTIDRVSTKKYDSKVGFVSVDLEVKNSETQIALSHEDLMLDEEKFCNITLESPKNAVLYNQDIDCEYL